MKKTYLPAGIDITVLDTEDVLTTSGSFNPNDGKSDSAGWT